MKEKKTFIYCEYCDTAYEDVSPAREEQYQQGFIIIGKYSHVLLTNQIDKVHFVNLQGVYCDINCLVKRINNARKTKEGKEVSDEYDTRNDG